MLVVLRRRFVLHLSQGKTIAAVRGPKSLPTKPVDSSKKMKKEDS
jgi:hypothetical protein